jgi:hypothetical protein
VQEQAVCIEEVVDAIMKRWVAEKLHPLLLQYVPPSAADAIAKELNAVIDVDIVPRPQKEEAPPKAAE